jgi:uncharacterized membrane protein YphA (DoxX/SURF4 family)
MGANIPFYQVNLYLVPALEMAAGILLVSGYFARFGGLIVVVMAVPAIYIHWNVDPKLLPLDIKFPVFPLTALVMGIMILWKGGGAWSRDLYSTKRA